MILYMLVETAAGSGVFVANGREFEGDMSRAIADCAPAEGRNRVAILPVNNFAPDPAQEAAAAEPVEVLEAPADATPEPSAPGE